jgi:AcrR family transcriptional regulator
VTQSTSPHRKTRANGVASRLAILDAAAHIAGERGYEGTSINAVSERSGLPASSIYWHFNNKDELIAAVIDRSYSDWIEALRRLADQDTELSAVEMYSSGSRTTHPVSRFLETRSHAHP